MLVNDTLVSEIRAEAGFFKVKVTHLTRVPRAQAPPTGQLVSPLRRQDLQPAAGPWFQGASLSRTSFQSKTSWTNSRKVPFYKTIKEFFYDTAALCLGICCELQNQTPKTRLTW